LLQEVAQVLGVVRQAALEVLEIHDLSSICPTLHACPARIGFETTAHTLAWSLFLVASHPVVASRLAAELDQQGLLVTAARPQPRQLTYHDLSELRWVPRQA
jgi:hypothetical protein